MNGEMSVTLATSFPMPSWLWGTEDGGVGTLGLGRMGTLLPLSPVPEPSTSPGAGSELETAGCAITQRTSSWPLLTGDAGQRGAAGWAPMALDSEAE